MPTRFARSAAGALAACMTFAVPTAAQHRAEVRSGFATVSPRVQPGDGATLGGAARPAPPVLAPRRSAGARLGLQFLAASAGAVGGGLGSYFLLRDASETRVKGDEGYTRSGNVGYLAGSFAGATLGSHVVGRSLGGRAPLWATALGALVGSAPLIALGVDEPYLPLYGLVLGWIPQGALAAGGFIMAEPR